MPKWPSYERAKQDFKTQFGAAMVLWVFTGMRTVSYFFHRETVLTHVVEQFEDDWLSPVIWGTPFLLLTAALITRRQRLVEFGIAAGACVALLWGLLFFWTSPEHFLGRGSVYLALCAMLTWGVGRTVFVGEEKGSVGEDV